MRYTDSKEDPLQSLVVVVRRRVKTEFALFVVMLGEVKQNSRRFKYFEVVSVVIDEGRNTAVWVNLTRVHDNRVRTRISLIETGSSEGSANLQEPIFFLLVVREGNATVIIFEAIGRLEFFQENGRFVP